MRRTREGVSVPLLAVALLVGVSSRGTGQESPLLVDPDWVAERLENPALVLLHVGPEEGYAEEHLPGAVLVRLDEIAAPEDHEAGTGLSLQMPEPAALAETLESMGIGDDSRVVVYYGTDWVTASTRVVYTLDWIGLGRSTSLLDGGMQRWKEEGHGVTAEVPTPERGSLTPRPRPELVVTADWVRDRLDSAGYVLVDARAPVHYDGIQPTYLHRTPVRMGHIPGAVNVPFSSIVDDRLRIRPPGELRALFAGAGVEPGDTVVGYCHLGQFATLTLFGARMIGHTVRLYDGSFQEWGSLDGLPVESGGGGAERP